MTDRELMQLAREKERADANEDDAKRWRNIKGYWRGVERELADAKERAERAEAELAALRERLAQPEQKPFCYHDGRNIVGKEFANHSDVFPLYTAPHQREWAGLTDKEIDALREANSEGRGAGWRFNFKCFARAIEASLKEKNT